MKFLIPLIYILLIFKAISQDYNYFSSGDTTDVSVIGTGGVCIMGGATEDDNAMIWFLNKAENGNVLVLRASGSNGYQDYLYNQLGVTVASVETIVMNNTSCGSNTFILDRISKADAIWFAGGDQFLYKAYLKDTPAEDLINEHVNIENQVIGGTSAGMAIQGEYYFDAENGTISSQTALNNPYSFNLTLDNDFLENNYLDKTITDTHFDSPDRKGRLSTFLARLVNENQERFYAIACEEYTAVCIENDGIAHVFGGYPQYDDKAYFIQTNCEGLGYPEVIQLGVPLTFNNNQNALHVLEMEATELGINTFNLNDWTTHNGGIWKSWYVENGQFFEIPGDIPNCALDIDESENSFSIRFSTTHNYLIFEDLFEEITLYSSQGKVIGLFKNSTSIPIKSLEKGVYIIMIRNGDLVKSMKWNKN